MNGSKRAQAWLDFAEEDLRVARLAMSDEIWNQVCFHAQQAAEKSLKAYLERRRERVPKIHSLAELVTLCSGLDSSFDAIYEPCVSLDRFYIPTRYPVALVGTLPEGLPSGDDAAEAAEWAGKIRDFVRNRIEALD
jgi:HEPN domain-containing protein